MKPADKEVIEGIAVLLGSPNSVILFGKDQPEYEILPAVIFSDGRVLTEWVPDEEELKRLALGSNIRLWIWVYPQRCEHCEATSPPRLQPVMLEVTGG